MFRNENERWESEARYEDMVSQSRSISNLTEDSSEELEALNRMIAIEEMALQSAMTRWVQERQTRGEELFPPSQVPQSKGSKARGRYTPGSLN